jgi:hypothetical protein
LAFRQASDASHDASHVLASGVIVVSWRELHLGWYFWIFTSLGTPIPMFPPQLPTC